MDYATLPARATPAEVNVVVESPRGSSLKLNYEPTLSAFTLSRPLPRGMVYPYDWGFVPSTRASDGDPLDRWSCGTISRFRELSSRAG